MKDFLHHLFVPHSKNNHRAKLLHNSSIAIIIAYFLFINFISILVKHTNPQVLGISYSISTNELLDFTNKARQENGLKPLVLNNELITAAQMKASDMLTKNYWAHFAPDGTTPWYFVKNSGYGYNYAGENLAKGFTTSSDTVKAWMNSTSHRENILSDKYNDIGFAVVEGKLLGEDTVLVVEMFGSTQEETLLATAKPENNPPNTAGNIQNPSIAGEASSLKQQNVNNNQPIEQAKRLFASSANNKNSVITAPILETSIFSKSVLMFVFSLLILAFIIDFIIVEKKKIPRLVGHNIDHITVILLFILLMIIQRNGFIV